jgi:hypothetical protein
MPIWKKITLSFCGIALVCAACGPLSAAEAPKFKDSICAGCHNDAGVILPKAPHPASGKDVACAACHAANPAKKGENKFVVEIHKLHQGEKTNVDCFACHPK